MLRLPGATRVRCSDGMRRVVVRHDPPTLQGREDSAALCRETLKRRVRGCEAVRTEAQEDVIEDRVPQSGGHLGDDDIHAEVKGPPVDQKRRRDAPLDYG